VKAIEAGLYNLWTGDATLAALIPGGVHRGPAPEGTDERFLSFEWAEPQHRATLGVNNGYLVAPMTVRVVDETQDQTQADAAADRMTKLLLGEVGSGLSVTGYTVMGVSYLGPLSYVTHERGRVFQHVGGRFSVFVQRQ
jgi:hypothetical protein